MAVSNCCHLVQQLTYSFILNVTLAARLQSSPMYKYSPRA